MFDEKRFYAISDAFYNKTGTFAPDDEETGSLLIIPETIKTPALLSAPHAVELTRDDKLKYAESDTAALAILMGEELGCPAIINVLGKEDPNYHEQSPYCDRAVDLIKEKKLMFALDLHESAASRPYSFVVGTGYGKNVFGKIEIAEAFAAVLKEFGFEGVEIDLPPYGGSKERTVASSLRREANIPAIQLEINLKFFAEGTDRDPERVYSSLCKALSTVLASCTAIVSGMEPNASE